MSVRSQRKHLYRLHVFHSPDSGAEPGCHEGAVSWHEGSNDAEHRVHSEC